ncbi:MAG: energy transducer TonB [Parahaliea sp.]
MNPAGILPLRLLPAFAGAIIVTLAVFTFMQRLIAQSQNRDITLAVHENIRIIEVDETPAETEQKQPETEEPSIEEPVMAPLVMNPDTASSAPLAKPVMDTADIAFDINLATIAGVGTSWNAPAGAGAMDLGSGKDASAYIQVTPFDTRKPNVPKTAWQNKISGWVLLAFSLTPEGHTQDIRILDANPRGVFEDEVISAVKDWRYSISVRGKHGGKIILTQRVEINWQDYAHNIPNGN